MSKRADKLHASLSDEAIIEMYWQREERAIRETDIKYGKFLFGIAFGILHDTLDCEECQNDTYLGVWRAIPPTRPTVFPAFIAQIMRRIAINKYKLKNSQKRVPSELTFSIEDYENTLESDDEANNSLDAEEVGKIISDYVGSLPERQRYIFMARFYFAESVDKISDDLDAARATVYRELDKIKRGLKLYLEENGVYI